MTSRACAALTAGLLLGSSLAHAQQYGSLPIGQASSYPRPSNGIQMMIYLIFRDDLAAGYLASEMDYV